MVVPEADELSMLRSAQTKLVNNVIEQRHERR
jgi:hypothetical protein